jgi:hypothetical protein
VREHRMAAVKEAVLGLRKIGRVRVPWSSGNNELRIINRGILEFTAKERLFYTKEAIRLAHCHV